MDAVAYGHKEVIKMFFDFDYSVDIVVKQGKMLLEWAIENGHLSLIEVIITLALVRKFKLRVFVSHCKHASLTFTCDVHFRPWLIMTLTV